MLDALRDLQEENDRLKALLTKHNIAWENIPTESESYTPTQPPTTLGQRLSTAEKIALFRQLFRGRVDTFPIRWESTKGHAGYAPSGHGLSDSNSGLSCIWISDEQEANARGY